jgi:2,4-dienoyl-CoA reductase-like NADH-dependent reductase (Old Yellow Enzyme family)/thioredoxin reductase
LSGFPHLFEPLELKGHTLRNRVVWLPHLTGYSHNGGISDRHIAYYAERARAGVGMIILGCETVNPKYTNGLRVNAFDPASVPGYRRLSDAVHEHGTVLVGQVVDDGNQNVCNVSLDWAYEYAPSAVADWAVGLIPKVMEAEDFEFSLHAWVACARNHVDGGYDGTELKVAHDGLLRQMLSPLYNQRDDEYGGDRQRRERFVREVLEAMRAEAGPEHIIGIRFPFDEFAPGGFDLEEGLQLIADITSWGVVDYVTSDLGVHTALRFCNPPMSTPPGFARYAIEAAHQVIDVPLIAYGRIRTPEMAEEILERGEADLIGVARALITDPEWVRKAQNGDSKRIRKCIGCNQGCLDRLWYGQEITCILNPAAGREARFGEGTLEQAEEPMRIAVVGGGPAGMKTAEVAARRGHHVTLFERGNALGGAVRTLAAAPSRRDFIDSTRWLEGELLALGVDIRLGREVDAAAVSVNGSDGAVSIVARQVHTGAQDEPVVADTVVIATGAVAVRPDVPGIDSSSVIDVGEALEGTADVGTRVVIVDGVGNFATVSAAQMLADIGRKVTVVTPMMQSLATIGPPDRQIQMPTLFDRGVDLIPAHGLTAIDGDTVRFTHVLDGSTLELDADTVVLSTGRTADGAVFAGLGQSVKRLHHVGDCVAPRDVGMAIYTAEELGRTL